MLGIVNENGILLEYENSGIKNCVKHDDIAKYWNHANEDEIEEIKVLEQGKYLVGLLTVASGQGGVTYVWNKEENKLVHISDGAFAVSAALTDSFIYLLLYVSSFTKKEEYMVTKVPFGTMNATDEGEVVARNIERIEWNGNLGDIVIEAAGSKITINCCGQTVEL